MSFTIELHNTIPTMDNIINTISTGFIFKYNDKEYIISTHHFTPILETSFNPLPTIINLPVIIKPVWNELLFLDKPDNLLLNSYSKIEKHKIKFLKKDERVNMKINEKIHSFPVNDYTSIFINKEFFPYRAFYLSIDMSFLLKKKDIQKIGTEEEESVADIYSGLSGSPVFDEKSKLVGVFCKITFTKNKKMFGLIVPTYYIIKTLNKKDNNSYYNIDLTDFTNLKLGKYDVKISEERYMNKHIIFNQQVKYYMDLDVYLALEGDIDTRITATYPDREIVGKYIPVPGFDFSLDLIKREEKVKLNRGLIEIIKLMNSKFTLRDYRWSEKEGDIWIESRFI
jgi:hypothetical protein